MSSCPDINTTAPTRVLLVEDHSGDARLIKYMLRGIEGQSFRFEEADSLQRAHELAEKHAFDVVLLDLSLPDSNGIDTVHAAQETLSHLPIIVMTGTNDDVLAVRAVQAGAQDFVRKGETDSISLYRCIRYAMERKRAEQLLAERNAMLRETNDNLRQLTFALTHDLQTPLASLSGAVEAFRCHAGAALNEESSKWVDRIDASTARMARMLDELMVFARANSEELICTDVELPSLVDDVLEELATAGLTQGVTIESTVPDLHVHANRDGLHRGLQNVITNAIRHNTHSQTPSVQIEASEHAGRVSIAVSDNGPGIPEKQLARVFLPFTRVGAAPTGTGLGLAIVRSHIERMGGRVCLESDGTTGTRAIIELNTASTEQYASLREEIAS